MHRRRHRVGTEIGDHPVECHIDERQRGVIGCEHQRKGVRVSEGCPFMRVDVATTRPVRSSESHGKAGREPAPARVGGRMRCHPAPSLEGVESGVATSAGGREGEAGLEHGIQACMLLDRWPEFRRPIDIVHQRITRLP